MGVDGWRWDRRRGEEEDEDEEGEEEEEEDEKEKEEREKTRTRGRAVCIMYRKRPWSSGRLGEKQSFNVSVMSARLGGASQRLAK